MSRLEKGFSLVEMLVALVLGLVLFTGVGHLVLASNKSWVLQDELARIQENARLALDILSQDIRSAGYTGCPPQASLANALYTDSDNRRWMMHFDKGILGIPFWGSSDESVIGHLDSNAISEAIVVHSIDQARAIAVRGHDEGTATVTLASEHSFDEGDLLALTSRNCKQVSVFRGGSATAGSSVSHPAGNSGSLYNCTSLLQGHYNCHTSTIGADKLNDQDGVLSPLQSRAFYLRNSNGVPTLYRKRAGEYTSGNSINAEALVEGIERLNLRYGVDSDLDGVANQYLSASDIGLYSSDWQKVVSVKLELLARSFSEVAPQPQVYFFGGQKVTPADQYVRRSFMTTIELRNRGL
ncbi:MAG: PilW family protein [Endozoicomonas sp.]